jgi:hypothetical protein
MKFNYAHDLSFYLTTCLEYLLMQSQLYNETADLPSRIPSLVIISVEQLI